MGLPAALIIGACMVGVMMGDGPHPTTQAKIVYDYYHYRTETLPARAMAAVQLHSEDHFRGIRIYG